MLAIPEIAALKQSLIEGKIDGTQYEGTCACFKGTIANARHCKFNELVGLEPDGNSPSELWYFGIKKGDTPENSLIAKITLEWIEEFEQILKTQTK